MIGSDNTPLVSFLVLTMNRSTEIEPCLESIFAQDYPNYEVIVIDNASVDNTCSVVSEKFPKAKLFRMEKNLGAAGGRNVAFSKSVGEICIVIDDDAKLSD